MSSNKSWLRVLAIVIASLLILGAVAFVAYRIGVNQGAIHALAPNAPQPPTVSGYWFDRFSHRLEFDGRHPMMRFVRHGFFPFFHPLFWLGLIALVVLVILLVRRPAPVEQTGARRTGRKE